VSEAPEDPPIPQPSGAEIVGVNDQPAHGGEIRGERADKFRSGCCFFPSA
jgi:hypothetical protein